VILGILGFIALRLLGQ